MFVYLKKSCIVLTCCLQAEVLSDLFVVTRMSEVEDAVTRQLHLKKISKRNVKTNHLNQKITHYTTLPSFLKLDPPPFGQKADTKKKKLLGENGPKNILFTVIFAI